MYRSSPPRSTLNTGYITGLDMCKVCTEAVHCSALWTCVQVQKHVIILTPPHPTPPYPMWCVRVWLWVEKMMQNCAGVHLWLQSVCAGDSGKWLCAHVTPVCVRGWLWVEKMMQNCGCVYLWLQSVCAGDPLTLEVFRWYCKHLQAVRFRMFQEILFLWCCNGHACQRKQQACMN